MSRHQEERSPLPPQGDVTPAVYEPSQGTQEVQNSVNFTNEAVLKATSTGMSPNGKILADQAAGMMMQDLTSFSQGMMQIMTAAIAKATAKVVETDAVEGTKALAILTPALEKLPAFIEKMGKSVQEVEGAFNQPSTGGSSNEQKPKKKGFFSR